MVTLHSYILRELLKTFALCVILLTALGTMGGGLYSVAKQQGVTAAEFVRAMPLMLPLAVTIAMPVAAIFASTLVYGRLAADNELVACRAAGINVHRLFLAVTLLAVFVSAYTLFAGNYLVPDFVRRLDEYVKSNIRALALRKLRVEGHMNYKDEWFVTAERVEEIADDELHKRGYETGPGLGYLAVVRPTLLQVQKGRMERFAASELAICQFDTRGDGLGVTLFVKDGQDYHVGRREFNIGPQSIRLTGLERQFAFPTRLSWHDLGTLRQLLREPWRWDKIRDPLRSFRFEAAAMLLFRDAKERIAAGEIVDLTDGQGRAVELRAASAAADSDGRPLLSRVSVNLPRGEHGALRYEAPTARIFARPGADSALSIELRLERTPDAPVRESTLRGDQSDSPRERANVSIDGLLPPPHVTDQIEAMTTERIFDRSTPLPLDDALAAKRSALWTQADSYCRRITASIHYRLGYSSSFVVTIIMGAILGIVFRGSRVLAAIGLACVPFAAVSILMYMGRQLAENRTTEDVGAGVIWGGLVLVGVIDLVLLRAAVRR